MHKRVVQEAQALRRQVQQADKETADRATLVKQEKLQRFTNKAPIRLSDVWSAPSLIGGRKKSTGTLECHANGFRFARRLSVSRKAVVHLQTRKGCERCVCANCASVGQHSL